MLYYASEPENGQRVVKCDNCTFTRITHLSIEKIHHNNCQRGPCEKLGGELRLQNCEACKGHVQIKVLACEVHGECTLKRRLEGIACCATCIDFSERAPHV